VEIIRILLDKRMSVELTNAERSTPLHLSAESGHLEATKTFVEKGAPLNKANNHGSTPLTLAARYGQIDVCHYLTEMGADINIREVKCYTALHHPAI